MDTKKVKTQKLDTKKMLKENGEKRTKIRFSDKVEIEILSDQKHLKKEQVMKVHKVVAERYVKDKVAKYTK